MKGLIQELNAERGSLIAGYTVRILDGNCIAATQHRLKPLREDRAAPLPGKSLVVYDPALGLVMDEFPCEDGHAQERSLLGAVLERVSGGEVWVAYNVFAVVLAALCSVHDDQTVDETVSSYALAEEVGTTYRGMMIAISLAQWVCFQAFTVVELATLLKQLAGTIRLSAFRKKRRGAKKPSIKKPYNAKRPHVSTAKALAAAAKNSSP